MTPTHSYPGSRRIEESLSAGAEETVAKSSGEASSAGVTVFDPFAPARFGGSPRTGTKPASPWPGATTQPASQAIGLSSSSGQVNASFCEQSDPTPSLFGASSSTTASMSERGSLKRASTAPSSATKGRNSRRSLSDRLTPLLMSCGLVRGITPTSTRRRSDQPILEFAFGTPVGSNAVAPGVGSSSSNAGRPTTPTHPVQAPDDYPATSEVRGNRLIEGGN